MIAITWTTKENSRIFKMFPEVNSGDATHGTNNETRQLYIGCNFKSDLTSNPHRFIFLPSCRRWVFNWIAKHATPMLHGIDTCEKVKLHIFNEDRNCITPFKMSKDIYPNATIRICSYHRVTQKVIPIKKIAIKCKFNSSVDVVDQYISLVDYIVDKVENFEEYLLVKNLILVFLKDSKKKVYLKKI